MLGLFGLFQVSPVGFPRASAISLYLYPTWAQF